MADETEQTDAEWVAMQSAQANEAGSDKDPAPFGYMTDPDTGEERPRKTRGRVRKSPSLDELKAEKQAQVIDGTVLPPSEDRTPSPSRRRRGRGSQEKPKPDKPVPQFREGVIERGVNQLYRRAGKLIKVMDPEIGAAIIDITRKEDPEDQTVGECWENLARRNPRIRAFLMKLISGGDWGALFMCHAPIVLAVLMKESVRKHIPFPRLAEAFLTPDEDGDAPADGTAAEGLTMPDMDQMMAMAQQFAEQAMNGRAAPPGPRVPVAPDGTAPDPPPPVA